MAHHTVQYTDTSTPSRTAEDDEKLADVKELAQGYRQAIKNNYPMEQWEKFGIMDKR